jgi:hypothetical protein
MRADLGRWVLIGGIAACTPAVTCAERGMFGRLYMRAAVDKEG